MLSAPDYTQHLHLQLPEPVFVGVGAHARCGSLDVQSRDVEPAARVRRLGINFGTRAIASADDGTLWLDFPSVGGTSPDVPLTIHGEGLAYRTRTRDSWWAANDCRGCSPPACAACGGCSSMQVAAARAAGQAPSPTPCGYTGGAASGSNSGSSSTSSVTWPAAERPSCVRGRADSQRDDTAVWSSSGANVPIGKPVGDRCAADVDEPRSQERPTALRNRNRCRVSNRR